MKLFAPKATDPRRRLLRWAFLLGTALAVPAPALGGDAPPTYEGSPPPQKAGEISVAVKAERKVEPDDPKAAERLLSKTPPAGQQPTDWHDAYVADPTGTLSASAKATLAVARAEGYDRKQAVHDMKHGGERVKPLIRALDVGRHEILKHLYHRAMIVANERLAAEGLSPLRRVQAVNAGGTGDFSRDQDITMFCDDPVREKAFFDAVAFVGEHELELKTDPKATGGVDFPEIEVTLFRGTNDLPDARFATDVEEFALKYQRAIENQAADPEAYKGGGADIEVKGRRVPGQMYVQQLTWSDGGPVYVAETPRNFREAASLFSGTAPERWQRFERAAHIFSDFLQARQHSGEDHADPARKAAAAAKAGEAEHTGHDPTKGPLKYTGRAVEHLCATYGMKPWPELKHEDRVALLRKVWPHIDPASGLGERVMRQMTEALDLAVYVKKEKALPGGGDKTATARQEQLALAFLRNATGLTLSNAVRDLLQPPAFDTKAMRAAVGAKWDTMSPVERFAEARRRDATFRAATSRAAMENLLVAVSLLRNMDFHDGRPVKDRPGQQLLARAMRDADARQKVVLGLASEYAEAWARKQQTSDPDVRRICDAELARVRQALVPHCALDAGVNEMPSVALLRKAHADGPRRVLEAETTPGRRWFSEAALDAKQAFLDHMKQAFPSLGEQWGEFRANVAEVGVKTYVGRRLVEEAFQWDTLADALTLVEMYQGGAGTKEYGTFLAINLVSRVHWSVGPLVQAFMVYDKQPGEAAKKARELGKSLVFMTLALVVPWAGSAKIAFDVARGTVVVTVGWAVGKANAALVDAVYTGEAGRTNESAAGTVAGRIRDAGVSVVPEAHVRKGKDPDSGEVVVGVDRGAFYLDVFRRATGADGDEVPRSSPPRADAARLVAAHDAFVRVLRRQAEQHGPTWVPDPRKPFVPLRLSEREVEEAITAFEPLWSAVAAAEVDRALNELAVREYRSYLDAEGVDVIREALVRRCSADLLAGVIEHWQVRLTAETLAARDVERTAVFSDWSVIATQLHSRYAPSAQRAEPLEVRLVGGRWRAVRREDGGLDLSAPDARPGAPPDVSVAVEARVDGVPVLGGTAFDGSEPVRVRAHLEGTGETSDVEQPVRLEVKTRRLRRLRKVGDADDPGPVQPGDLVEDVVTVRALASDGAGPELARTELRFLVVLPPADGSRRVPVWQRVELRRDGTMRERYHFIVPFAGMPSEWVKDGNEVHHGEYERFHEDGATRGELRRFRFGVRHGKTELFDTRGRLVMEIPYVDGELEGDDIQYDPDSQARRVYRHAGGRLVEQLGSGTRGQRLFHITYRYAAHPEGRADLMSGEASAWWSSGPPRWHGRYRDTHLDLNSQGGVDGEEIGGKDGVWEWWFADGRLANRTTFSAGVRDGAYESWRFVLGAWERPDVASDRMPADGDVRDVGAFRAGRREGRWEHFDGRGRTVGWTEYAEGEAVRGLKVEYHPTGADKSVKKFEGAFGAEGRGEGEWWWWDEEGRPSMLVTMRAGKAEGPTRRWWDGVLVEEGERRDDAKHGRWTFRNPDGSLSEEGSFVADERDGLWKEHRDGRLHASGPYRAGRQHGRWTFYGKDGKTTWTDYADGEVVASGRD